MQSGRISKKVIWKYIKFAGILLFTLVLFLLFAGNAILFVADYVITQWTSAEPDEQKNVNWIWMLLALTGVSTITGVVGNVASFASLIRASNRMHYKMIECILMAPLRFFHANPAGRILNRFSKDIGLQDERIPYLVNNFLFVSLKKSFLMLSMSQCFISLIGICAILIIDFPLLAVIILIVGWLALRARSIFMKTTREVKRFSAVCRSPVYAELSQNLEGHSTIRAFGMQNFFQKRFDELIHLEGTWSMGFFGLQAWFVFRIDSAILALTVISTVCTTALAKRVSTCNPNARKKVFRFLSRSRRSHCITYSISSEWFHSF